MPIAFSRNAPIAAGPLARRPGRSAERRRRGPTASRTPRSRARPACGRSRPRAARMASRASSASRRLASACCLAGVCANAGVTASAAPKRSLSVSASSRPPGRSEDRPLHALPASPAHLPTILPEGEIEPARRAERRRRRARKDTRHAVVAQARRPAEHEHVARFERATSPPDRAGACPRTGTARESPSEIDTTGTPASIDVAALVLVLVQPHAAVRRRTS